MKMVVIFNQSRKHTTFSRYGAPGFQTGGSLLRVISFGQQTLQCPDRLYVATEVPTVVLDSPSWGPTERNSQPADGGWSQAPA